MSEFIYLYRRPPTPGLSPKQLEERMQRWRAWFDNLEKNGHLVSVGQPLASTGGGVVRDAKGTTSDGPYAETKDIVIGYSVIVAADFSEAVRLTADWPAFDEGGVLEIRPVMMM